MTKGLAFFVHWLVRQNLNPVSFTPFTRSSKHQANIKQAWWNPAPWLKCRPRLSPQMITRYIRLPIPIRLPS